MMMKVPWRELLSRLNGLGFGPISASWIPPVLDRDVAASVIAFLDDREVLYASTDDEVILYSMESVERTRRVLTEKLMMGGTDDELADHLRAMRAACRYFARTIPDWTGRNDPASDEFTFLQALGEFRATFGVHIAYLAAKYQIDVEEGLASILPPADEDAEQD
jgi:hypothetical protein